MSRFYKRVNFWPSFLWQNHWVVTQRFGGLVSLVRKSSIFSVVRTSFLFPTASVQCPIFLERHLVFACLPTKPCPSNMDVPREHGKKIWTEEMVTHAIIRRKQVQMLPDQNRWPHPKKEGLTCDTRIPDEDNSVWGHTISSRWLSSQSSSGFSRPVQFS